MALEYTSHKYLNRQKMFFLPKITDAVKNYVLGDLTYHTSLETLPYICVSLSSQSL